MEGRRDTGPGVAPAAPAQTQARPGPVDGNRATNLLLRRRGADDPIHREVERVAREVGADGGTVDPDTEAAIRRSRGRPLDDGLRRRMESGFGTDLSAIRVHADGEADTLSRAVRAEAFASGTDLFFSAGRYRPGTLDGDELIAHELAHTVDGDDEVRRVYAGLEYTEGNTNQLQHFPGAAPAGEARIHLGHVGGQPVSYYAAAPGTYGAQDNVDRWLLAHGRVRLTNDVFSSEWQVEGHEGADLSAADRLAQMTADITALYALRDELVRETERAVTRVPGGQHLVMVRGDFEALPLAPAGGIFRHIVGGNDGHVQITVQYTSKDTIRRINELNASRYLKGSKPDPATDAKQVTGAGKFGQKSKDFFRTTSFSKAHHTLLSAFTAASANVEEAGEVVLTAADVGVIKLMVVNDAMAMVMTRHNNPAAQGQEKNLQRFFPKSHRPNYVRALSEADLTPAAFHQLQVQLDFRAAETAALVFEHADAKALRPDETMRDLAAAAALLPALPPATQRLMDIRHRFATGGRVTDDELDDFKAAILGADGALLAARIRIVATTYTDPTNAAHRGAGNNMNVLGSSGGVGGFTPLAGPEGGPAPKGAVYEMRHHEIAMAPGTTATVVATLKTLLEGA